MERKFSDSDEWSNPKKKSLWVIRDWWLSTDGAETKSADGTRNSKKNMKQQTRPSENLAISCYRTDFKRIYKQIPF